jgi:hypothetical protein
LFPVSSSPDISDARGSGFKSVSNKKTVTVWLTLLTIGVIFLGLYSAGYLTGITRVFEQGEDFTTYFESDSLNRLSQTEETSRFTMNRLDEDIYLYRLYDDNGDFTHRFKFYLTSIDPKSIFLRVNLICYSDSLGNFIKIKNEGGSQIFLSAGSRSTGKFFLMFIESQDKVDKISRESVLLDLHNEYEVIIKRKDNHFTIKILDEGNEIDEISYILQQHHEINYLMCPQSLGYPRGDLTVSGVIRNLIL